MEIIILMLQHHTIIQERVYNDLGNNSLALQYYEKALHIQIKIYGDNHPNVATSYINIGSAYNDLGNKTLALQYYEKARQINIKAYGDNHPDVANHTIIQEIHTIIQEIIHQLFNIMRKHYKSK